MTVVLEIRLFATLKDRAGSDRIRVELPDRPATAADVLAAVAAGYPALAPALRSALVAVNRAFAGPETPVNAGDEVALFPPVSGGAAPSPSGRGLGRGSSATPAEPSAAPAPSPSGRGLGRGSSATPVEPFPAPAPSPSGRGLGRGDSAALPEPSPNPSHGEGDQSGGLERGASAHGEGDWPTWFAVTPDPLDIAAIHARLGGPEIGAIVSFTGFVRGRTQRDGLPAETLHLDYEAYEAMAVEKMAQIAREIWARWPMVRGVALVQRLGRLAVGDVTTFVACAGRHRDEGVFEAARYGIDRLKEIVPVWKKEIGADRSVWIEGHYRPTTDDNR